MLAPVHRPTATGIRALRVLATAVLAALSLLACSAAPGSTASPAPSPTPQAPAVTGAPSPSPTPRASAATDAPSSSSPLVPAPASVSPAPAAQFTVVTVCRGDTLWGLARSYHTTVGALQQANGLGTSDLIRVGQQLRIPAPPRPAAQKGPGTCVDHSGADGFAIGVCTHVLNATQVQPDIYLNTVGNTAGCSIEIELWSEDGYGKLSDFLSQDCTTKHQVGITYTCDPTHGGGDILHADAYLRTSNGAFRVGQGKTVHLTCPTH